MGQPKGSRNIKPKKQDPIKISTYDLTCKVTGRAFPAYEKSKPISMKGWAELSDEQKHAINLGAKVEDII